MKKDANTRSIRTPLEKQCSGLLSSSLSLFSNNDGDLLAILAKSVEMNNSVCLCIQSIILAEAYVLTRMDMSSTLSVKNVASLNKLSVRSLSAKSLGLGITAVLSGTDTFLMSEELKVHVKHNKYLP